MANPSRVMVLVEDRRQQTFLRRYLYRLGYSHHDIVFEDLPVGGSGEQWVRNRYSVLVKECRGRQAKTALLAAIDADTGTVATRQHQLAKELTQAGMAARAGGEAIAHLIPRRNIETWVFCLTDTVVDEETDHKDRGPMIDVLIKPAALNLFEWSRPNAAIPAHCIPSIHEAIAELSRL